jgi:hypothetical protein
VGVIWVRATNVRGRRSICLALRIVHFNSVIHWFLDTENLRNGCGVKDAKVPCKLGRIENFIPMAGRK